MSAENNPYKDFVNDIVNKKNNTYIETPKLISNIHTNTQNDISSTIPTFDYTHKNSDYDYHKDFYISNKSMYEEIYIEEFPLNFMYKPNYRILIRPCTVKEIQDYSTYDNNNPFEFRKKLDDVFRACVILLDSNDNIIDVDNIYDNDKYWIILTIREKTFPDGKKLSTTVKYNNTEESIEICRGTLDIYRNEPIMEFFDDIKKCFVFETTFGATFEIAPPTVGIKKAFDEFLIEETKSKSINAGKDDIFYKIAPYLMVNKSHISTEELYKYKEYFQNKLSIDEYAFLHDLIYNQLKIGIRGLKKNRDTGIITTTRILPNNTKDIFFVSGGFNLFIKR